jgi:hypothetical protein
MASRCRTQEAIEKRPESVPATISVVLKQLLNAIRPLTVGFACGAGVLRHLCH